MLPDAGGWLDQDLELTIAFDLIEEIWNKHITEEARRAEAIKEAHRRLQQR